MSGIEQNQVILVTFRKSIGLSIFLTFMFGPLGMLYSTILGAVVMGIISLIVGVTTFGFGLIITWPICIIWGAVAANSYNKKWLRQGSKDVKIKTSHTFNNSAPTTESFVTERFDRAKWNALLEYDNDIAIIADRLQPLGQKWLDEFASSYLALNDKQYLPEIEHKIVVAAGREAEAKEQEDIAAARTKEEENEQLRIRAEEQQKAHEEQQKAYLQEQERRSQARKAQFELWRDRLTGNRIIWIITSVSVVFLVVTTVIVIELWQRNLKITENELRLDEEHNQVDEIHRRVEEEQARGLARIAEMEKHLAEENTQMDEARRRTKDEQSRASRSSSPTAPMTSVPKIFPNSPQNTEPKTIKPSFDCTKATTFVEREICNNATLANFDAELGRVYHWAKTMLPDFAWKRLHAEQLAWLNYRDERLKSVCVINGHIDTECARPLWEKRIAEISNQSRKTKP